MMQRARAGRLLCAKISMKVTMYISVFQAATRAVVTRRGEHTSDSSIVANVALFVRPPQPEGAGYVEYPEIDGYARQTATFVKTGASQREPVWRNREVLRFPEIGAASPKPTHVGLFDAAGNVISYGMLDGIGGRKPEGVVEFRPSSISLKWV